MISEHVFDDIQLNDFYQSSCKMRIRFAFILLSVLTSLAVYLADLWTAVSLLVIGQTTVTPAIPTEVSKWIFFGCITVSFLLLGWDTVKAYRILKTKDISYNFTCGMANNYLSLRWKRLLLAEAPRQVINTVTLQALVPQWLELGHGRFRVHNEVLGHDLLQRLLTVTMAFSVLVFTVSFAMVCAAVVLYLFLIFRIRGNLKEYICHKANKQIERLLPWPVHQVFPRSSSHRQPTTKSIVFLGRKRPEGKKDRNTIYRFI
ncbi:hypothetical protein BY458DRAFT_535510 [Sporodiniella umbellata]|nr:hypothetical protein BY458DRAFT_535510 [Sporodiniella umbellata]